MHVGDILHLRLGELMVAGLVRELEHVERHAPHTGLRQRVEPGDVRALVVDLRQVRALLREILRMENQLLTPTHVSKAS